jgi:hypothetical protein
MRNRGPQDYWRKQVQISMPHKVNEMLTELAKFAAEREKELRGWGYGNKPNRSGVVCDLIREAYGKVAMEKKPALAKAKAK